MTRSLRAFNLFSICVFYDKDARGLLDSWFWR